MQPIKNIVLGSWALFNRHQGFRMAESLSYITLLCFVPVVFVALSLLASFHAFDEMRMYAQNAVLDFLSPQHRAVVESSINTFLDNAQNLSWPGVVGLMATALTLFFHIESAFETLWETPKRRSFTHRALLFWALLTLGPLGFGMALVLSAQAYEQWAHLGFGWPVLHTLNMFVMTTGGFWLFYRMMPNSYVPPMAALSGAIVAAALLRGLKISFAYYVDNLSSYNTIYGTLATIPVFLLLLYAIWIVVILGACVTVFWEKRHGHPLHP